MEFELKKKFKSLALFSVKILPIKFLPLSLLRRLRPKKSPEQIIELGIACRTFVRAIHFRTNLKVNGQHPWVVVVRTNDGDHEFARSEFISELLDFDPSYHLRLNDELTVYVNPANHDEYYLDTRFIREKSRRAAQAKRTRKRIA